jgi:hypothetical protein
MEPESLYPGSLSAMPILEDVKYLAETMTGY